MIKGLKGTIGESRGNFSRQPNATVDFSVDRKTEISHSSRCSTIGRPSSLFPSPASQPASWDRRLFKLPDVFPLFLPLSSITRQV